MTTATKGNQIFKTMIWIYAFSLAISIYMMNMEIIGFPTQSALETISFQSFQRVSVISIFEIPKVLLFAAIFTFIGFTKINSTSRTKTLFASLLSYSRKFIGFLGIVLVTSINTILTAFLTTNIRLLTTNFTQPIFESFGVTKSSPFHFFMKTITAFCVTMLNRVFIAFFTDPGLFMIFSPLYSFFATFVSTCLTSLKIKIVTDRTTGRTKPIRNSFFSQSFMFIHNMIIAQNKQKSNFILSHGGNIYAW